MNDEVITKAKALEGIEARDDADRKWRADLMPNVTEAIRWANEEPISLPGEIIFNIRDNGQVWTYTYFF